MPNEIRQPTAEQERVIGWLAARFDRVPIDRTNPDDSIVVHGVKGGQIMAAFLIHPNGRFGRLES